MRIFYIVFILSILTVVIHIVAQSAVAGMPAASKTPRTVVMIPTSSPPVLDGHLNDPAWRGKAILDSFILNRGGNKRASAKTEVIVTYDSKNLYLGIRAFDNAPSDLVTKATQAEPSRVWGDDVIEIFIDATHDRKSYHHFGVNALGTRASMFSIHHGRREASVNLNAEFKVAVDRGAKAWTIEIAIPFARLRSAPASGEVWGFNVNRGNPRLREYSSWAGVQGGFGQPKEFGLMRFPSDNNLRIETRGFASRKGNADQSNVFSGVMQTKKADSLEVAVTSSAKGKSTTLSAKRTFKGDGKTPLRFAVPYTVSGSEGETVSFCVKSDGKVLYQNTVDATDVVAAVVWQTADPLYKELFGKNGPGIAAKGTLMWSHRLVSSSVVPTICIKHAQPYELGKVYSNAAKRRLRYFNQSGKFMNKNLFRFKDYADQLGLKFILFGNRRAKASGKPSNSNGYSYLIDPENQEVYIQQARKLLKQYKQYIWAFSTGDEVQEHDLTQGLRFHYKNGPYPFMKRVDREVKKEFGYGKFGIPTSLEDKNPFRWIAYRRWYNDRFCKFQKRIYETVKAIAPEVYVIGPDPMAAIMPLDYAGYGRYTDIMTHQLYPRNNPYRQSFACITKTVRDLGGKPTLPCAHVENYANSYRPAEVRELMSQVYRGGGEGFHLYMPDTANRFHHKKHCDMRHDCYGSWPRWETVMGVLDLAASNPRPRLPEVDCAILYSNDAHMGEILGGIKSRGHYRSLLNLLGPAARGWFQVISDNQVARGEIKLSRFRTIYVPHAIHQRKEVVAALVNYVESGGRLVVPQPDAFTWHLDGTRMDSLRAKLMIPMGKVGKHTRVTLAETTGPSRLKKGIELPLPCGASLQTGKDITVLLRYEDGSAAMAYKTVGKGKVYTFGFDPLYYKVLSDAAWREFWKFLHAKFTHAVDLDIWRFTFPEIPAARKVVTPPPGVCLTNNYVVWDTNEAIPMRNRKIAGTYSYSLAPDLVKDEGGLTDIPFTKGDLMDRRQGLKSPNAARATEQKRFAVGWTTKKPVTVTFDLGAKYPLRRFWIIFNGELPETIIEGEVNGTWRRLGQVKRQVPVDKDDFPAVSITLDKSAPPVRRLRMRLGTRRTRHIIIPEIEIWARD